MSECTARLRQGRKALTCVCGLLLSVALRGEVRVAAQAVSEGQDVPAAARPRWTAAEVGAGEQEQEQGGAEGVGGSRHLRHAGGTGPRSARRLPAGGHGETPPGFDHAVYGPQGYLEVNKLKDMDAWFALMGENKAPFFETLPTIVPGVRCDLREPDPVGSACIWSLYPNEFNPALFTIPDDSPLRAVGTYLALTRPAGPKGAEWFGATNVPGTEVLRAQRKHEEGHPFHSDDRVVRPKLLLLGDDLRIRAMTFIYDQVNPFGWVDPRIFTLGGEWWLHFRAPCLTKDWPPKGVACADQRMNGGPARAVMARLVLAAHVREGGRVSLDAHLAPDSHSPLVGPVAGKNHAFFEAGGRQFMLVTLNPTVVHEVFTHNASMAAWPIPGAAPDDVGATTLMLPRVGGLHLNGGKLIHLPATGEYLGMGHHLFSHVVEERQPHYARRYLNFFFTLEDRPPFRLARVSAELCFESVSKPGDCEMIQFASGMALSRGGGGSGAGGWAREGEGEGEGHTDDLGMAPGGGGEPDRLLIPVGVNRHESKVMVMELAEAVGMLRPVSELSFPYYGDKDSSSEPFHPKVLVKSRLGYTYT